MQLYNRLPKRAEGIVIHPNKSGSKLHLLYGQLDQDSLQDELQQHVAVSEERKRISHKSEDASGQTRETKVEHVSIHTNTAQPDLIEPQSHVGPQLNTVKEQVRNSV